MDLLWMILLVVQVCAEVQNVKEVKADLDGDVTLTCSIRNKDVHWFMEIQHQLRVKIGRTYSSRSDYCSADFETKYLIQENRLVIKNITAEDSRTYFCGEKINHKTVFVDTIHLNSGALISPSTNDCGAQNQVIFIYRAALILVVLASLIVALLSTCLRRNRKQMNEAAAMTCETPETQQTAV